MINQDSIDQFYIDVDLLRLKHPGSAISAATGFSKGTVSMYLNKKDEPSENFIKAFYEKFGESLKKVKLNSGTSKNLGEPGFKYSITAPPESLHAMILSNKTAVDANKITAESNLLLAQNNKELIDLLKMKTISLNSDHISEMVKPMLRKIVEVGLKEGKWQTDQEGQLFVGRALQEQSRQET